MTTQQQIDQINKAIEAIENGAQEYQIGTKKITRANIATLYHERERLENKLYTERNGGVYVATFDRR